MIQKFDTITSQSWKIMWINPQSIFQQQCGAMVFLLNLKQISLHPYIFVLIWTRVPKIHRKISNEDCEEMINYSIFKLYSILCSIILMIIINWKEVHWKCKKSSLWGQTYILLILLIYLFFCCQMCIPGFELGGGYSFSIRT